MSEQEYAGKYALKAMRGGPADGYDGALVGQSLARPGLIDEAQERLTATLQIMEEALKVLGALDIRLFGPEPAGNSGSDATMECREGQGGMLVSQITHANDLSRAIHGAAHRLADRL